MKRFIQNCLYSRLEIIGNELLDKILAHNLLCGVPNELNGTLIPNIHSSIGIDTENGCICCIDETCVLPLLCNTTRDILSNTNNSNNVSCRVPSRGCIQQNLNTCPLFCHERKFVVGSFVTSQCSLNNRPDTSLIILSDEFLHKILPHNFIWGITNNAHSTFVPNIHTSF